MRARHYRPSADLCNGLSSPSLPLIAGHTPLIDPTSTNAVDNSCRTDINSFRPPMRKYWC